ncbi:hypothetical protein JCM10450v2_007892 [Rhodotorula kratochvilovae]
MPDPPSASSDRTFYSAPSPSGADARSASPSPRPAYGEWGSNGGAGEAAARGGDGPAATGDDRTVAVDEDLHDTAGAAPDVAQMQLEAPPSRSRRSAPRPSSPPPKRPRRRGPTASESSFSPSAQRSWSAPEDAALARCVWEHRALVAAGDEDVWAVVAAEVAAAGGGRARSRRLVEGRWGALREEDIHVRDGGLRWSAAEDARLLSTVSSVLPPPLSATSPAALPTLGDPLALPLEQTRWPAVHTAFVALAPTGVDYARSTPPTPRGFRTPAALGRRWRELIALPRGGAAAAARPALPQPDLAHWSARDRRALEATVRELGGDERADDGGWDAGVERAAMWVLVRAAVRPESGMGEVVGVWRARGGDLVEKDDGEDDEGNEPPSGLRDVLGGAAAREDSTFGGDNDDDDDDGVDSEPDDGALGASSWSAADDALLLRELAAGTARKNIAATLRRSTSTVNNRVATLRKAGHITPAAAPRAARKRWSAADDDALVRLRSEEGLSLIECARRLARPYGAVSARVTKLRGEGRLGEERKSAAWGKEDDERVVAAYGTKPVRQIAKELGRSYAATLKRVNVFRVEGRIVDVPPAARVQAAMPAPHGEASPAPSQCDASPPALATTLPRIAPTSPEQAGLQLAAQERNAVLGVQQTTGGTNGEPAVAGGVKQRVASTRWTAAEDQQLLALRAQGVTFADIDRRLSRPPLSSSGRYRRIANAQPQPGPSATSRSTTASLAPVAAASMSSSAFSSALPPLPAAAQQPQQPQQSALPATQGALPPYSDADDRAIIAGLQRGAGCDEIGGQNGRSGKSIATRVGKRKEEWVRLGLIDAATLGQQQQTQQPVPSTSHAQLPAPAFPSSSVPSASQAFPAALSPSVSAVSHAHAPPTPTSEHDWHEDYAFAFAIDPALLDAGVSAGEAAGRTLLGPEVHAQAESSAAKRPADALDAPPAAKRPRPNAPSPSLSQSPAPQRKTWLGKGRKDPWRRMERGMDACRRLRGLCEEGEGSG